MLALRKTQVLRLLLVVSYLSILSVLYSGVYIIVSPFAIYLLLLIIGKLRCVSFDLRIVITPLIFSNFFYIYI